MLNKIWLHIVILLSCVLLINSVFAKDLQKNRFTYQPPSEYFSYCENGSCLLANGDFFNQESGLPADINVTCRKDNQYALTFDDGPSQNYPQLLEILKRNNVKATFFIIGEYLEEEQRVAWFRQAVADGHFMANHTYRHEDLTSLDAQSIIETLENTRTAMINAVFPNNCVSKNPNSPLCPDKSRLEFSTRFIRPPYGSINMAVDTVLKAQGYISVRWNADRFDWNLPQNDPNSVTIILNRVQQQFAFIADAKAKGSVFNQSILDLNHDFHPMTIAAVENLIALVKAKGYEFVTLDECLGLQPSAS